MISCFFVVYSGLLSCLTGETKDFKLFADVSQSTKQAITFSFTGFSSGILISIFTMYNVDLFISVYELEESYFYYAQIVYALWNSINDPVFGWLIDHTNSKEGRRTPAIKYGGFGWALVFLIPWFPWSSDPIASKYTTGVHFLASICSFDAFLTYVLLVHCALLADLTVDNLERNKLNNFASVGNLLGSCIGAFSYFFWDKKNLYNFRLFCILASVLAACGFWYTGSYLKETGRMKGSANKEGEEVGMWEFFKQLSRQKNFWLYVALNSVMNFNAFVDGSFFTMYDEKVISPLFSPTTRWIFVSAVIYIPKLMVQVMTPFADRYGTYSLIYFAILGRLILASIMYLIGLQSWQIWMWLYLAIRFLDRSWGFYNLVFSDVIDEDMLLNNRTVSLSASMHGIQAIFVKPAQSLGPMVGVWLMSGLPYRKSVSELPPASLMELQQVLFSLMCIIPGICGVIQLIIWNFFDLHGANLRALKDKLASSHLLEENNLLA